MYVALDIMPLSTLKLVDMKLWNGSGLIEYHMHVYVDSIHYYRIYENLKF